MLDILKVDPFTTSVDLAGTISQEQGVTFSDRAMRGWLKDETFRSTIGVVKTVLSAGQKVARLNWTRGHTSQQRR